MIASRTGEAKADEGGEMTLKGKWRIPGLSPRTEMEALDEDYPDLAAPAHIEIDEHGQGELAFGARTAALGFAYAPGGFDFTWDGVDEGDQVTGDSWA